MNEPMVSIIIPVYNVEKYLGRCLESVLSQTFRQFEVILVDDGSTDSCGQLCDEFAVRDNRIRVIHKENGGLMSAWRKGLEEAYADDIVFVDSDDWIAPRMFEVMLENRNQYQADMVICNMCLVENGIKRRKHFILKKGYYDEAKLKKEVYPVMLNAGDFQLRAIPISRCGKMIKKKLLQNNLMYCDNRISYSEDLCIIFPTLLDCNSLVIVDDEETDYFYRMNPSSILHSYNKTMHQQIQLVYEKLFEAVVNKGRREFEEQLLADYLAAMVQCYKNELMNPGRFVAIKNNINILRRDRLFAEAVNRVDWHGYRKLNVLIIYIMCHWNIVTGNCLTFFLYCLKHYRMNRLERHGWG